MHDIYTLLDDDGIWVCEQSYLPSMMRANGYDTICHEHLTYFRLKQIVWMAERVGFTITDVGLNGVNGGSFIFSASKKSIQNKSAKTTVHDLLALEEQCEYHKIHPYELFKQRVSEHKKSIQAYLAYSKRENRLVYGYGASTKGNVLLQYCELTADDIPYIVEVNHNKFGRYTPGSCIPILSEVEAQQHMIDSYFILPWHFRENIEQREHSFLQRGGSLVIPFPEIEVIRYNNILV